MDLPESHYVEQHCQGQIEYRLPDHTRVDCLTDEYATEYDWCKKWAEFIGQSFYYAKQTNRKSKPQIILLCKRSEECFIRRTKTVAPDIKLKIIY